MILLRRIPAILLMTVVVLATLLSACNKDVPQSELDRFVTHIESMPRTAVVDTLRILADGPMPAAAYACYELGNVFYSAAAESARIHGWNDDFASVNLDSAQIWFESAVARDSTFVEAYVNLGSLWDDRADMMAARSEREVRVANARDMYEKALSIRPYDEKARCNLGSLHKRQNNFEAAMNEYLAVLEHDAHSSLAHYNLAILFATQKIYREALTEFELAVKFDPDGDIGDRSRDNMKIIRDLMEIEAAEVRKQS